VQQYEQRVSLTPEAVEVLVDNGHEVLVESRAGEGARYTDNDYSECGGCIIDTKSQVMQADIILKVSPLDLREIENA
jgi:alanine dehydrogenase